jgi:hypothetical protein
MSEDSVKFKKKVPKVKYNVLVLAELVEETGFSLNFVRECVRGNSNRQQEQHDNIRKAYKRKVTAVEAALKS